MVTVTSREARPAEALGGLPDAPAAVAHGVHLPGHEEDRGVGVHFGEVFGVPDEVQAREHLPEEAQRCVAAAEGIRQVAVHVLRVQAQPVAAGAVGGEELVVGAEGQTLGQLADLVVPAETAGLPGGHETAARGHGGALLARAHDDGGLARCRDSG